MIRQGKILFTLIVIQLLSVGMVFADDKVEFNAQVSRKDVEVGEPFHIWRKGMP